MTGLKRMAAASGFLALLGCFDAASAQCSGPPIRFSGKIAEVDGELTVRAGTGCRFSLSGTPGTITEARIIRRPKHGRAGVQGVSPFYVAKRGYKGPDEFGFVIIGTDQFGSPMRITVRRKVTVVP